MAAFRNKLAFCSNFYPAVVHIRLRSGEVIECATVEHAYAALKTLNDDERLTIVNAETPAKAKRLGGWNGIVTHHRVDWDEKKVGFMRKLLREKFSHLELAAALRATGNEELVEENGWHDNFWGSCYCPKCGNKGQNTLGKLLMEIRSQLK